MQIPLPKSALGIAAGIGGLLFVGYCIYFDQKRHSDPNFRKKLREKRRQKRLSKSSGIKVPDLRDQEAVQRFFLAEVQLGETLLSEGDVDGAVEHLGAAIAVCGHPQQLLQILQQTLPPTVFNLLLQRLPTIGKNFHARHQATHGVPVGGPDAGLGDGEPVIIGLGGSGGPSLGGPGPMGGPPGGMPASFITEEDELE